MVRGGSGEQRRSWQGWHRVCGGNGRGLGRGAQLQKLEHSAVFQETAWHLGLGLGGEGAGGAAVVWLSWPLRSVPVLSFSRQKEPTGREVPTQPTRCTRNKQPLQEGSHGPVVSDSDSSSPES